MNTEQLRAEFEAWWKDRQPAVSIKEDAFAAYQAGRAAVLADHQQRGGDVLDDMRAAVRFAPSSAYWSERLREFFGPDAREGIDALEKQLREARAALHSQDREDAATEATGGDENGGHRLVEPDHETAMALADAPRSLRNYVAALRSAIALQSQPRQPEISRDLLGKIVDEVFDGAIEDAGVIEDIYRVVARECALQSQDREDAERLDWLLRKLPGDAIRYCVGVLDDTADIDEFREAIDHARRVKGEA